MTIIILLLTIPILMLSIAVIPLAVLIPALSFGLLAFSMILCASQVLMALLSSMFGLMNVAGVAMSLLFSFVTTSINLGLHLGPVSQAIYNKFSQTAMAINSTMENLNSEDAILNFYFLFLVKFKT
ncbi:MAG: hypothetical protein QXU31_00010 [Archaeoglobaceae archaeon]